MVTTLSFNILNDEGSDVSDVNSVSISGSLPTGVNLEGNGVMRQRLNNFCNYILRLQAGIETTYKGFTGTLVYIKKNGKIKSTDFIWTHAPYGPFWTIVLTNYKCIKSNSILSVTVVPY